MSEAQGAARVVITHQKGSKANQIEQVPLAGTSEILLGRDHSAQVIFDPDNEDLVSRRHAIIDASSGGDSFGIADLDSSNGTFVNGNRVQGRAELVPGDVVQLGKGGPQFVFDVEPRPASFVRRTRVVSPAVAPTRISAEATADTPHLNQSAPSRPSQTHPQVGRHTVMRMLAAERSTSQRLQIGGLVGVVAVLALAGGLFWWKGRQIETGLTMKVADSDAKLQAVQRQVSVEQQAAAGRFTPQQMAQKFSSSVVYVENSFRLFDKVSGKPVYHKILDLGNGKPLPLYVRVDGRIYRWLTTDDRNGSNVPMGSSSSGTAFVVNSDGFLLTNKHVAAPWTVSYSASDPLLSSPGLLVDQRAPRTKKMVPPKDATSNGIPASVEVRVPLKDRVILFQPSNAAEIVDWIPEVGGYLFAPEEPDTLPSAKDVFEGRNEVLNVRFADNNLSIAGRLLRSSHDADMAVMKVDVPHPLVKLELAPEAATIAVGEPIVVMGYPGISPEKVSISTIKEGWTLRNYEEKIPQPTVTDGIVAKLGAEMTNEPQGNSTTMGQMGDAFQLTVLATGTGNSGGPVFNAAGKVIGMFTYVKTRLGSERVTFAVPIRHAYPLMQLRGMQ